VHVRARAGGRGGAACTTLEGRDWIEETLGGVTFRLPPATFVQVNADAAAGLLDAVVAAAGDVDGQEVLDLYGGVGAYGIALAGRGARVTVVDADGAAVRCGREAARRSGRGAAFVRADARRFLDREGQAGRRPHLVIANPPRTGCGPGVAQALGALAPARLIVVSCDPATLARDVKQLRGAGYRLLRAVPFDLFPQTAHVETLLLLER
jgi:23S rRNA (uracil1939-C5)-methyltransferase